MVEYPFATEEQKELAEIARTIMEKELKPRLHEFENANDGKGIFPLDVLKKMAEAGFYCMDIPEEWGGLGLDVVTKCIIQEEMSKVDAGFTFNMNGAGMNWPYLLKTKMPDEEKQMWIDRMLAGDATGAFCFTEPQAGSDAAAIKTTAVHDEEKGEWIINGTKCFVTNGPCADYFIVAAWTDKTKSAGKGITLFFVEKDRGVQVGSIENKLGLKLSMTSDVIFDEIRVPDDHMVGAEGSAFIQFMQELDAVRVEGMIYSVGIAQAAVDEAVKYAKVRQTFGKRIIDHEALNFKLADMQIRTDASRALLYQGAQMIKAGLPLGTISSSTKCFVTESTMQTTLDAVQVLGGYGYMKDYPVEKLMRDAKIFCIFDGTNEINRMVIGRLLDKKY